MEKSSNKSCITSTPKQIWELQFITVSQIKFKVTVPISGDAMVSVNNSLLFMGMWKDPWTVNPNLQILGGKSINDIVVGNSSKLVNLKILKNQH